MLQPGGFEKGEKQMKIVKQRLWVSRTKYRQHQVVLNFTTFSCLKEKVGPSAATKLWEQNCFTLELYHVEGEVRTKAEAIQQWLHDGYLFDQCLDHFSRENFRQCQPPENFRQVDSAWKSETRLRLFHQSADHLRKFRDGGARTPSPGST